MGIIHYAVIISIALLFDALLVGKEVTYQIGVGVFKNGNPKNFFLERVKKRNGFLPTEEDIQRQLTDDQIEAGYRMNVIMTEIVNTKLRLSV